MREGEKDRETKAERKKKREFIISIYSLFGGLLVPKASPQPRGEGGSQTMETG